MSATLHHSLLNGALIAVSAAGVGNLMAPSHAGIGAILAFHRVYRPGRNEFSSQGISVAPERFRRVLEGLIGRGYTFVTMSGLLDVLAGRTAANSRTVCLTFDDGFADTYTSAFAICREYRVPMTVYLVSGFIKRDYPMWGMGLESVIAENDELAVEIEGEWLRLNCRTHRAKRKAYQTIAARLAGAHPETIRRTCRSIEHSHSFDFMAATDRAALTPVMIREMKDSELVEFGAHSARHPRLSELTDSEARWEIASSKSDCETLVGCEMRNFAYPYGDAAAAGDREHEICAQLGFSCAVTTESSTLFPTDATRPFALPRLTFNGALPHEPQLDLLLSGVLPAVRRQWHRWRARRAAGFGHA